MQLNIWSWRQAGLQLAPLRGVSTNLQGAWARVTWFFASFLMAIADNTYRSKVIANNPYILLTVKIWRINWCHVSYFADASMLSHQWPSRKMTHKLLKRFAAVETRDSHFAPRGAYCFHRSMLCDLVAMQYLLIPLDVLPRDVFSLLRVALHASPQSI